MYNSICSLFFGFIIESLKNGETKINSSTLYPYDIIEKIAIISWNSISAKHDEILEQQWKALPNYVEGENNIIVIADTSSSMNGRPMSTSLGLSIYFAERNKGIYANKFMTFSSKPHLVTLKGNTLYEKLHCIKCIVDNTNLQAAFELILNTAKANKITQDEIPKALVVITDMQFDSATTYRSDSHNTWFEKMEAMFNQAGYQIPNIVFWNVKASRDSFQTNSEYKGVQMYSGQSTSTFKALLSNIGKTPYQGMLDVLNNSRYEAVTL